MNKVPDSKPSQILIDLPEFITQPTSEQKEKVIVIASLQKLVDLARIIALAAGVTATCSLLVTAKLLLGWF